MASPTTLPAPHFLTKFYSLTPPEQRALLLQKFYALSQLEGERLRRATDSADPFSLCVGLTRSIQNRNRYMNVIPFDRNRIALRATALTAPDSTTHPDYINASLIDPAILGLSSRKCIVTQGPLDFPPNPTVGDFWLMAWEQHSPVIVCLTRVEVGCARYWPAGMDEDVKEWETSVGGVRMRVRLVSTPSVHQDADCEIRKLWVEPVDSALGKGREIIHLACFGWPDHGVPENAKHVLSLIRLMHELEAECTGKVGGIAEPGPTIVHCSAGCGRTGIFCTIDNVWRLLEKRATAVENDDGRDLVYEVVDMLRQQRKTMVEAPHQYEFCYRALGSLMGLERSGK
ncbi:protein-tyrosine phosphatase-like protein [Jimgerdemannia flammicorona]|uniref:Protein-tyrosine phosphatase-like protein n=1 Tax=Jimgerdemannia flammicorona TaxID=994334 RepID=A0A433QV73_9FUNG|nr:protein-tyrosine phosphatase-like protein [Jimgerdemannia flammicorona]